MPWRNEAGKGWRRARSDRRDVDHGLDEVPRRLLGQPHGWHRLTSQIQIGDLEQVRVDPAELNLD